MHRWDGWWDCEEFLVSEVAAAQTCLSCTQNHARVCLQIWQTFLVSETSSSPSSSAGTIHVSESDPHIKMRVVADADAIQYMYCQIFLLCYLAGMQCVFEPIRVTELFGITLTHVLWKLLRVYPNREFAHFYLAIYITSSLLLLYSTKPTTILHFENEINTGIYKGE